MNNLNKLKNKSRLRWYHFVVFWLPGGMFLLTSLLLLENNIYKNNNHK